MRKGDALGACPRGPVGERGPSPPRGWAAGEEQPPRPAREPSPGCVGPDKGEQSRGQRLGDFQELGEVGSRVPRECPRDGLHTRTREDSRPCAAALGLFSQYV